MNHVKVTAPIAKRRATSLRFNCCLPDVLVSENRLDGSMKHRIFDELQYLSDFAPCRLKGRLSNGLDLRIVCLRGLPVARSKAAMQQDYDV